MLRIEDLSFWEKSAYFEKIDFLIVGSGIVGMSTALFLRKKYTDAKIVIIERGYLPTGASSKNAGFTCFGSPTELYDDLKSMKENEVWETFSNRYNGLKCLFELIPPKAIDYVPCKSWDLIESGVPNEINPEFIGHINEKAKEITGVDDVYSEDHNAAKRFGFENIQTSYCNQLEGAINTGMLIQELHKKTTEAKIQVVFGVEALSMNSNTQGVELQTNKGLVSASNCIIATNGFAKQWIEEDIQPARAQVLVTNQIKDLKVNGTFHFQKGYYYFRNVGDRVLLGGGRNLDFKGETTESFETTPQIQQKLEELIRTTILPNQDFRIEYSWSGIMGVGNTKSPIVKMLNNNTAIGVRLGGMGVALGSQVGKSLANYF
jgi:glycine/D-amino acid oxidase-like deaminating enzyme